MLAAANAAVVPGRVTEIVPGFASTAATRKLGHEITLLFGSRHDFLLQRIVFPPTQREATGKQQQSAKRKQAAAPSAPHLRAASWRLFGVAVERGAVQPMPVDRVI